MMMRYQLRDEQGATRSVAYLMLAAVPVVVLTGLVLPDEHPVAWVVAISLTIVFMAGGGWLSLRRPHAVPRLFWLLVPFVAVGTIAGLNLASRDAGAGSQLFYLWPVLYTANFLSHRVTAAILVLVSAGHASVAFEVRGFTLGLADWISVTVALSLTAIVVASLRNRNDRLREVLESQARADSLTGVANRRSFDEHFDRSVTWARESGEPLALLTIDIDHFKTINDTWGHGVGDRALQVVATCLRTVARRENDMVARLGGDEFAVLLRTDRLSACRAADEVRAALSGSEDLPCGAPGLSIGIALMPDHADTAEDLRTASDTALYQAKQGGRGRTAMAHPPTNRPAVSAAG